MKNKIESMNKFKIMEMVCEKKDMYGVYINSSQFEEDALENFKNNVKDMFKEQSDFIIESFNLIKDLILFEDKDDALKLYEIMNKEPFYGEVFSVLISPDSGIIEENT
jgi:hypothetical protein